MAGFRIRGVLFLSLLACAFAWGQPEEADVYLWVDAHGSLSAEIDLESEPLWANEAEAHLTKVFRQPFLVDYEDSGEWGWELSGYCDGLFQRTGLHLEGTIPLNGLSHLLRSEDVEQVYVMLNHPRTGFAKHSLTDAEVSQDGSDVFYEITVPVDEIPGSIQLTFGFQAVGVVAILAWLVLVVVVPLLFLVWRRAKALNSEGRDPARVWFGYWRATHAALLTACGLWLGVYFTGGASRLIDFIVDPYTYTASIALTASASLLPCMLIAVLCALISHPVKTRIRGLDVSRFEVALQTLSFSAMLLLPVILFLTALGALLDQEPFWTALCVVGAFVGFFGGKNLLWRSLGVRLEPLTVGDLRDRVFALAAKAFTSVNQVYILTPGARLGMANAGALHGNRIVLTDNLVERLTKSETDAIIAHELGHVRRQHAQKRVTYGFVAIVVSGLGTGIAMAFGGWLGLSERLPWVVVPLAFGVLVAGSIYAIYRFQETQADSDAVTLTDDPEALITGLAKLHSLNMLPLEWGRWHGLSLAHPSALRRVIAIARKADISTERLSALLREPNTGEGHYAIPDAVLAEKKPLSAETRRKILFRNAWTNVALFAVVPACTASLVLHLWLHGTARWAVYGAGLVATMLTAIAANSYLAFSGWPAVIRRMRAILEKEGIDPDSCGARFVSLSPGAVPRVYDGFTNWDVGFLGVAGDRLWFIGDNTRFAIPREAVMSVSLSPAWPGWYRAKRVAITWHNPECDESGTFAVWPGDVRALHRLGKASRRLKVSIEEWLRQPPPSSDVPAALAQLPVVQPMEVTGMPLKAAVTLDGLFKILMRQGLWSFWVCVLFRLLWSPSEDGPGYYAISASLMAVVIFWGPMFIRRATDWMRSASTDPA
jgi:STE24 endopeptidase